MLDGKMRRLLDPTLDRIGRGLAGQGVPADAVTLVGLAFGLLAAGLVAAGLTGWALAALLAGRLADGLDGAVARATRKTDFGGYLDITCDFLFYGAVPFGFVLLDPERNGASGAFLLASFYVNGASFLGFAILAEKRNLTTRDRGEKSLYFTAGLLEGTETIIFFGILCLWPQSFALLSWGFGSLCIVTAVVRVHQARVIFGETAPL